MNDSKYLYHDFYDGIIHILIMCLPIIVGTMNELLSQEDNSIIPISLTIAIASEMYSVKDIWKDDSFSNNLRIKIEMLATLLLLFASLIYTAIVFSLSQVSTAPTPSEILENAVAFDSVAENVGNAYTVPTILYGASVAPYLLEAIFVLINEFKNCHSKGAKMQSELTVQPNLTSAEIN